jgi:hypothetical protein
MRGYADSQARQIFRDLIDMPADVIIERRQVSVRFHRRGHADRSRQRPDQPASAGTLVAQRVTVDHRVTRQR